MLVNDNYNFLFIHIQKTAGSSIGRVLKEINGTRQLKSQHTRIIDLNTDIDKYYKFCFVRNPWDRLVSWYNMHLMIKSMIPFQQYLMYNSNGFSDYIRRTNIINCGGTYKSLSFNQLDYITNKNGSIDINFIGKFENINEDFNNLCGLLNLSNCNLPHINKFNHKNYREYYNDEDREYVAKLYQRDIDYFGYNF